MSADVGTAKHTKNHVVVGHGRDIGHIVIVTTSSACHSFCFCLKSFMAFCLPALQSGGIVVALLAALISVMLEAFSLGHLYQFSLPSARLQELQLKFYLHTEKKSSTDMALLTLLLLKVEAS